MAHLVFISHASADQWIAGRLKKEIVACGAECFLDAGAIETGDEVDAALKQALNASTELVVLFTPAALDRPYVWMEIGVAWGQDKRIVGILHGLTTSELTARDGWPPFLTGTRFRDINEFDEYLDELRRRIRDA
jgi:hypothetical protein